MSDLRLIRLGDSDTFIPADAETAQALEGVSVVNVKPKGQRRSLDQNSMIYALYQQVAEQKGDESIQDIRRECKAYCGVPILLAENEQFAAMYRKGIMPHLTVEEKLQAMDVLPVTRLMSKKQATKYIDEVIRRYSMQGYSLVHPSELANAA